MGWRLIEENGQLVFVKRKFSLRQWWREFRNTNVNLTTNYKSVLGERGTAPTPDTTLLEGEK